MHTMQRLIQLKPYSEVKSPIFVDCRRFLGFNQRPSVIARDKPKQTGTPIQEQVHHGNPKMICFIKNACKSEMDKKITRDPTSSRRTYSDHVESFDESPNSRLNDELLHRHRQKFRPVRNPNDTLLVYVLAALYQIVDVNQKSNLVGISAYFDLVSFVHNIQHENYFLVSQNAENWISSDRSVITENWWYDEFLTWKPDDFNGANETYLPAVDVWVPDLYLYHSVEGSTPLLVHQSAVQIDFMGRVRLFVPFTAKALCTINVKYFPFDTQVCQFQPGGAEQTAVMANEFGSWSFREHHIQYVVASSEVTLHEFFDNQEWYLVRCNLTSNRSRYANGDFNETYSTVRLTVELERGSFYYIFNLIIPTTLVTIVSVIGFHASANSTERRESKFRLGIMTLLSMGVLLLNVVNDMPKFSMVSVAGNRGSFSDAPILGRDVDNDLDLRHPELDPYSAALWEILGKICVQSLANAWP
uniref:Neurotransmitter-gated ion-channel ligand-binding domain-containing protein n=1 Tax=Romanomermis culicivorax TaxID=13658 RepID=A0A915K6H4_ROMCU